MLKSPEDILDGREPIRHQTFIEQFMDKSTKVCK
jgi:hypothetical protein